ncbi:MAG TPA: hypothetical protein VF544_13130 [Pyrinomonadaceae bacterium]|jgi:hypothetical protein
MSSPHLKHPHHQNVRARARAFYDDYRTAFMNHRYYECRLDTYKKWNLYYEIGLAIGTSGTVAAWYLWKTPLGAAVWPVIAGAVAVMSILKPLLNLSKRVETYSKLYVGYTELFYDLQQVKKKIEASGSVTDEILEPYAQADERFKKLALEDEKAKEKLLNNCVAYVKKRNPPFEQWYQSHIVEEVAPTAAGHPAKLEA